jgi:DNA-binding transcriptional ArsR family regulator
MAKVKTSKDLIATKEKMLKFKGFLRALNHPLRDEIMGFIRTRGSACVTDIITGLKAYDQSVISQQLGILRKHKIVTTKRDGRFIFYRVNDQVIAQLDKTIDDFYKKIKNL